MSLIVILPLLLSACTGGLAGGGDATETGNALAGNLVFENGGAAAGARVALVPEDSTRPWARPCRTPSRTRPIPAGDTAYPRRPGPVQCTGRPSHHRPPHPDPGHRHRRGHGADGPGHGPGPRRPLLPASRLGSQGGRHLLRARHHLAGPAGTGPPRRRALPLRLPASRHAVPGAVCHSMPPARTRPPSSWRRTRWCVPAMSRPSIPSRPGPIPPASW